ncbi:MAG: redoxin domain-containing protein [Clostridiales bacterium]|nr:redoxin domain-containing protein [Clostridiales bacterium]
MSNRVRKVVLTILTVALLLCSVLATACGSENEDGKVTYSIYVTSMGGLGLPDVSVTATSTESTVAAGQTDSKGKFTFKANKGEYDIIVTNLPLGYTLVETNRYKTSAKDFSLVILATSTVIQEKIPDGKVYRHGDVMYDFTITDSTDKTKDVQYTLSDVLRSKRMVLLNFWNVNCVPCMNEMPELELAYRQYKEYAEVFGINVPVMGENRLSQVRELRAEEYIDGAGNTFSLTFPLSMDDTDRNEMALHFALSSIPVTVIVDRYGVIAYMHVGSMDKATFASLFAKYTSDDYVQEGGSGVGPSDPSEGEEKEREKPTVSQPASSEIEDAINGVGFNGSYYPETQAKDAEYSWPWLVGGTGDEKYIYPANHGVNYSFATIYTEVTIPESDIDSANGKVVLLFDLQWSCENLADYFYVIVNNTLVYEYTGTEQWGKWQPCYAIVADEPGDYVLGLMYYKDDMYSEGADTVRIKNMRLISIPEIDIPSLDMPRQAARGYDGNGFEQYITVVRDADGFYHKDSVNGPYILADLMNYTQFNNRLKTEWSVSEFAINGYFDYNTVDVDDPDYDPLLDDTDAIALWAQAANSSELYGLTVVNDDLINLLNKFIATRVKVFDNRMWLELCKYFDHYGTDTNDTGINTPERNPVRGLLNITAIPTVAAYDSEFSDLKNIPAEYKNKVLLDRLIVPRGIKYVFIPEKSGVYRFRSQSKLLSDTMAWLYTFDDKLLVETDSQLENANEEFNFVMTYYLEKGVRYIIATCFADIGGTGEYTFTTEYLGAEAYVWQYASRDYFTTTDDKMTTIANYMNVQPVLVDNKYYNAKKDASGNYVKVNGEYIANIADPIYVDFLTGARFFDQGSLELCFSYSDKNKILKTLSEIFSDMWQVLRPSEAGWGDDTRLVDIKGASLTAEDWIALFESLYYTYGDNVYIDDELVIEKFTACTTIGEIADLLKALYLNFFDQTYWQYDDKYGIDESRYKDYTIIVRKYYNDAKAFKGTASRGYADRGCVQLTWELRDALDMFCKRIGGFPELDTDWIRLCAHFEYFGPNAG